MNNEYLAPLVDEFFNLGVREAVFSPGSRSTALAMLLKSMANMTLMSILMSARLLFLPWYSQSSTTSGSSYLYFWFCCRSLSTRHY